MNSLLIFARRSVSALALALLLTTLAALTAQAQTTAFTYQGRFSDSSVSQPTGGTYTMTFRLYDAATGGNQIPNNTTAVTSMVSVVNSLFTVKLDFGATAFSTTQLRYLEIQVGGTILTPRQEITSTPFANRAVNAASADALSANCVGCVTNAQINSVDGGKITGSVASATTATTAGNVSGVVAIANGGTGSKTRNFVDLTTDQTVGGNKTFSGILSGDGSGLRNISGANVAGSTTLNPQRLAILRFYDVNQATLSRPIPVVGGPYALAFDGTFVYAANYYSSTVTRIRASTGAVEGSAIAVGSNPYALAFDGTFVYVANSNSNTVTRIRASTGVVEGSAIAVGSNPYALAFDGTFVYVANSNSNTVTRIRASTGVVEGSSIAVGINPIALAFDGTFVYVANNNSNTVTRIRASTGVVEDSAIAVGNFPRALAFDGTFVYVANIGSNNVQRF